MVLEIIILKFSCFWKIMSRNTFPEPQPDSAAFWCVFLTKMKADNLKAVRITSPLNSSE